MSFVQHRASLSSPIGFSLNTVLLTLSGIVERKNFFRRNLRICLQYLVVLGEYAYMKNATKLELFAVHKIVAETWKVFQLFGEYAESI